MLFKFLAQSPIPRRIPLFYIDHGAVGFDSKYPPYVKRFYSELLKKGIDKSHIIYREFPFADHTEADWARRVHIPLKLFLGK